MNFELFGKNAIVLASTEGIGKTIANDLFNAGCNVAICSRNKSKVTAVIDEFKKDNKFSTKIIGQEVDLTNREDIEKFFQYVQSQFGNIDILITNIGGPPVGKFEDFDDTAWYQAFDSIFMSVIRSIRYAAKIMKENNQGRIIAISSLAAKSPQPNMMLSNAMRCGLSGLLKTLANEFAPYNITVNWVCPGYTATQRITDLATQTAKIQNIAEEEIIKNWVNNIPLKKMSTPSEISSLVCYLCSKYAATITGTSFTIDGGFYQGL
jgi:3-oxoacyl-[acyl-carrier protein] reductase